MSRRCGQYIQSKHRQRALEEPVREGKIESIANLKRNPRVCRDAPREFHVRR